MALNFRRRPPEEPEVNLIPFIDVLLVILIFLMLSTTYGRPTALRVALPTADAAPPSASPREVIVTIAADGRTQIGAQLVDGGNVDAMAAALMTAAAGDPGVTLTLAADGAAAHQRVVAVMDAARRAGLVKLVFAVQAPVAARR